MASSSSRYLWITIAVLVVIALALFYRSRENAIHPIRTAKVERQQIQEVVVTNGKAEPIVYRELTAAVEAEVIRVPVLEGDLVKTGQTLIELSGREAQSDLEKAQAELADAEEALRLLRQGGTTAEVSGLKAQIENGRRERDAAAKQVRQNERLIEKGAVARVDLEQSRARLAKAESDLAILEAKLNQPFDPEQMKQATARVESAKAALELAAYRNRATTITAPMDGVAYSIAVRPGDPVHRGDIVARVGDVSRIRVRVFVDEPDLGRVQAGQPVVVTWDGLPGKQWKGEVERLPAAVEELGSRTVGEVACTIDNPADELLPNANLNVEIITQSKPDAMVLPREAISGEGPARYVYVVRDGKLARQSVKVGIVNPTRAEILEGVQPGDEVALSGDAALQDGMSVRVENTP